MAFGDASEWVRSRAVAVALLDHMPIDQAIAVAETQLESARLHGRLHAFGAWQRVIVELRRRGACGGGVEGAAVGRGG